MAKIKTSEKEEFIRYCKGRTVSEIAAKYQLSNITVRSRIREWNCDYKRDQSRIFDKPKNVNLLLYMKSKGMTNKQIADHFECTERNIRRHIKKHGCFDMKKEILIFEVANNICKNLGYKGSVDYIAKNGADDFRMNIKPKIWKDQ
jgi:DNA-binding CsgD family transcriptional regulator